MLDGCNEFVKGRVSVIIPTFNYGRFIGRCIESVLDQNVSDLEIIVVDDGSTDNTRHVVEQFKNRPHYIFQENAGPSAARNTGIVNCTGEWLLFLDADDLLGPDAISYQVQFLQQSPRAFISVVRHEIIDGSLCEAIPRSLPTSWTLFRSNLDVHLCYFNIAPPAALLFKREVILESGGFQPGVHYCEDYDLLLRAVEKGFIPNYNPKGLVYYRRQPASASQNLVKLYQHDQIMHWRVSKLLHRRPEFPEGRRVEGLLALSAGALLTAARLDSLNLEGAAELVVLALRKLEEAGCIARRNNRRSDILTKLFVVRIVSHATLLQDTHGDAKEAIDAAVREIRNALGAPTSKIGNMIGLLRSSLGVSREFEEERREIRNKIKNFLKSRIRRLFAEGASTR
jgi:GT2 family glycosyltransferase